jgi:hypothetical protein
MTPDCWYDPLCPYNLGTMNFYYQMYMKDFDARFNEKGCSANERCNFSDKNYTNIAAGCSQDCNSESCLFSAGQCFKPCFESCELCYGADNGQCFKCVEGKMQFFSYCYEACPRGYLPHYFYTSLCVKNTNTDIADEVYVTATRSGSNLGTYFNPFWSLAEAIYGSFIPDTTIWVLRGSHILEVDKKSSIFSTIDMTTNSPLTYLSKFRILGAMCSNPSPHPQCADEPPVVLLTSFEFQMTFEGQQVIIENLRFDGASSLVKDCTAEACLYCPFTSTVGTDTYDDRGQFIGKYASLSLCAPYADISFITITGLEGSLELIDVEFANFRYRPASLLKIEDSLVTLTRVTFYNNQSSFKSTRTLNGLITISCTSALCKPFTMVDSKVSFLNNGFEYSSSANFAGFLNADGLQEASISRSVFEYNYITRTSSGFEGALLSFGSCVQVLIEESSFSMNYASGGLIVLTNESLDLGTTVAANELTHIVIRTVAFSHIGAWNGGLVNVSYLLGDQHNIAMSGITVTDCIAPSEALLSVKYSPNTQTTANTQGKLCSDGTAAAKRVSLTSFKIIRGYGSILNMEAIPNTSMKDWEVSHSGEGASANVDAVVWSVFRANEAHYITLSFSIQPVQAQGLVNLSSSFGLSFESLTFDSNTSTAGPAGLNLVDNMGVVASSRVKLTSNLSKSLGGCLYYSGTPTDLQDFNFTGNTNTEPLSGIIYISHAEATLTDFIATANNSTLSFLVSQSSNLTLTSFTCAENSNDFVGCVVMYLVTTANVLKVQRSSFAKNFGSELAGVINIKSNANQPLIAQVDITDSVFRANKGGDSCSVMLVDSNVKLRATILTCTFTSNQAVNYGAILLLCRQGSLLVKDSQFISNSGEQGAAISFESIFKADYALEVTVDTSTFKDNQGSSVISATGHSNLGKLVTKNVTLQRNQATAVYAELVYWVDEDSLIADNQYKISPAALLFGKASADLTRTTLTRNSGAEVGGAITLSASSVLKCRGCVLSYNEATSQCGVVSSEKSSVFNFTDCTLKSNRAVQASIFCGIFSYNNAFVNCTISENVSTSALMSMISSNLTIINSFVMHNRAALDPCIALSGSSITVLNSTFSDQVATQTPFLQLVSYSSANITSSRFANARGASISGAIWLSNSAGRFDECSFTNITSDFAGIVYLENQSTLNFSASTVQDVSTADSTSGFIVAYDSTVLIDRSSFKGGEGGGVRLRNTAGVMTQSVFRDLRALTGAGVYLFESSSTELKECEFYNNTAEVTGGALHVEASSSKVSAISIESSVFRDNSAAVEGGAVYIKNTGFVLSKSAFKHNRAASGGGIRLICSDGKNCSSSLSESEFASNSASLNGGSFYWQTHLPVLANLTFSNNSAVYGPDIASFPVALKHITSGRLLSNITGVASGQTITQPVHLALIDHYGAVVTTDNSSQATVLPADSEHATVSGNIQATAVNGVLVFNSFKISTDPGTTTEIIFQSDMDLDSADISVTVEIEIRECWIGESLVGKDCVVCPPGSYNLVAASACEDCPTGAVCYGNATMAPKKGYWRPNNETDDFFACPNKAACLGGEDPYDPIGLCEVGYYGNMCSGCISGYSRFGSIECLKCPSPVLSSLVLTALMIGMTAFGIVFIKSAINSAYKPKSLFSVYIKIFMNYLQLVFLATTFNLSWPRLVLDMFAIQQQAGGFTEQIFSIDCEVRSDSYFNSVRLMTFLPLIISAVVTAIWLMLSRFRKIIDLKSKLSMSCIILFFLIHPSIVKKVFTIFNCTQIEPHSYWLTADLSVKCWDTDHSSVVYFYAAPSIIIWCVAAPLLCLIHLIRRRKILDRIDVKLLFGFLFHGYSRKHFYWEFTVVYRKILIISCSVFLSQNIPVQALTVMILLLLALHFQSKLKPYINDELNAMELRSILVATLTIYCGLYFLTGQIGKL